MFSFVLILYSSTEQSRAKRWGSAAWAVQDDLQHRFQPDHPAVQVVETALLLLHQPRHLFHLVVHSDHGGERLGQCRIQGLFCAAGAEVA